MTKLPIGVVLFTLLGSWTPLPAQEGKFERLELRVSAVGPGNSITVDRGTRDNLAVGDLVMLYPREGGVHEGEVMQIRDRAAVVQLRDPGVRVAPGTRGEVLIPAERLTRTTVRKEEKPTSTAEPLPWENKDEAFVEGMPLLAEVKPVRPRERAPSVSGRVYTIGNITQTSLDDFNNSFVRVGTEFVYVNPFGEGGELLFDGEFNYKTEVNDEPGPDLLLQRLAYVQGGTRFDATRWAFGRFLQYGLPEFGVLDGVEWSHRTEGGNMLGASFGFMPEPDDDYDSFADLQLAAYYLWSADEYQELTIGGGYQKTAHHGDADRDLFVAKFRYIPPGSWYLNGTFWVDYYTAGDTKSSGFDLTQVVASLGRRWDDGGGIDLSYRHQRFPDIDRNEYIPILATDLVDDRYDRLTLTAWKWMTESTRLRGYLGGWDDESESGGFAELGLYTLDYFSTGDHLDISGFFTLGQFDNGAGARVSYGWYTENGSWDFMYEIADYHHLDFPNDRDDILQQRLRASRSFYTDNGWSLTFDAETTLWDEEWSWALGFYVQKSF